LIRDNGDFHRKSTKPLLATDAINGHIRTAVGCTTPEFTKALNREDPEVILL
jgi:hypothetical protein